ncbi:hypothetical protein KP509_07G064000 [Ceratopteris richardii]|uniref:FAD-binding PCMH-type domain-containing protein n=1 Tax=Ceratopteris richardii TaxID=49495 RepID=A0A8T2UM04_CERRI|nr:hypothetical protein KP509_07G064000 [Ceratopteris richardii]
MRQFVLCITIFCLLCTYTRINAATTVDSLVGCLRSKGVLNYTTSGSPFYSTALDFSMQNLRFTEAGVPKPAVIILPSTAQEVQKAWTCMLRGGWALRVRNGGHSYEGLSSSASAPFAIIDLINMHKITVNVQKKTAWIEAGVRIGELYHAIASQSSNRLGFPAGTCSTVGMSGQIMGGGYGMLSRKYGVAADRVLQAQVIDGNGKLIKRVSTSNPDLFWALRGGGGGAWGIVVAWKLKLVDLPETITTFSLWKTGKQVITDLVYKWQTIAPKAPPELFIAIYMAGISYTGSPDMGASFYGQYWGTINETLALLNKIYPELGLSESDCKQGNWMQVDSLVFYVLEISNRMHSSL